MLSSEREAAIGIRRFAELQCGCRAVAACGSSARRAARGRAVASFSRTARVQACCLPWHPPSCRGSPQPARQSERQPPLQNARMASCRHSTRQPPRCPPVPFLRHLKLLPSQRLSGLPIRRPALTRRCGRAGPPSLPQGPGRGRTRRLLWGRRLLTGRRCWDAPAPPAPSPAAATGMAAEELVPALHGQPSALQYTKRCQPSSWV